MDGIKIGDLTLFFGELPYRKSLAFYFKDGVNLIPVAFVKRESAVEATKLWERFTKDIPGGK